MNAEPQSSPRPLHWPPVVHHLKTILGEAAETVYLVGGIVRDAYWGIPAHDVDLAVAGNAFSIARKIANALDGAFYKLDPERETGRAIVEFEGQRIIIDVATFRGSDLLADLTGRDFTLNAVAAPLSGDLNTVIDPLHGLTDAQARILRRCAPDSIASDPIRALRAVRMSTRFKLRIEPDTLADIRREGPRMLDTSAERLRDEFMAILDTRAPAAAFRTLEALGLLALIVPEVQPMHDIPQSAPHQYDVWTHTLQTVGYLDSLLQTISSQRTDNTAAQAGLGMIVYYLDHHRHALQDHLRQTWPADRSHRELLMLAALLHDSGKPTTFQQEATRIRFLGHEQIGADLAADRAAALRLSRQEQTRLATIIQHHMRPHLLNQTPKITRRAVYRFWRDTGPAGIDICLLALADYLATVGPTLSPPDWGAYLQGIDTLLNGYFAQDEGNVTALPALVTGKDLIAQLDLAEGPQIGVLLEHIREAQAAGEISTPEEALNLARQHLTG
jgi:poly(A) polymerase